MDALTLLALLDRPIAVHPVFIKLAGSHTGGVMLSQAFYWTRVMQKKRGKRFDGWFYKSREEWEEETLLKRREQENARKLLRATGFWQEERRDNPARLYYRIDLEIFAAAITKSTVPTRRDDPYLLEGTEGADKMVPSEPSPCARPSDQTETTTMVRKRGAFKQIPDEPPQIAPPFTGLDFLQVLSEFEAFRRSQKKPLIGDGRRRMFAEFEVWGEKAATQALGVSVMNSYMGVKLQNGNSFNGNGSAKDDYRGPVKDTVSRAEKDRIALCPACHGTGTEVVPGKGARPCKHEALETLLV